MNRVTPTFCFRTLSALLVMLAPSVTHAASISFTPISLWEFNEPAGTPLIETVDSVGGRVFNRGIAGAVTTGDGRLSFATAAEWPDVSTALPDNPDGFYRITVEFAAWDVSTYPTSQGPRLFFGLYEGDDLEVGVIGDMELQFFGDGVDLYFSDSDEEFRFENFAPVVLTSPLTVVMTIDKQAARYTLSYSYMTDEGLVEDSITAELSVVSAERVVGTFGITSRRNFAPAGSTPPQIERVEVAFGGPEPLPQLWAGATELTDGWLFVEWFGVFFPITGDAGWTYHVEHGWVYIWGTGVDSLFIYDPALDEIAWTSATVYPFMHWFHGSVDWTFYHVGGEPGERLFYDYAKSAWVAEASLFVPAD